MPGRVTTLRYLTRFRCIADACEDTCCAGMQILVGDADRERKVVSLSATAAGRAELAEKVLPLPDRPHGFAWALARDERGACRFLEPTRLCSLVRRFGDDVLSESCALFPRVVQKTAQRTDVVAALACPEAARLCLLAEDAVDPVDAPEEIALAAARSTAPGTARAEDEQIREKGRRLLLDRTQPLSERLLALWSLDTADRADAQPQAAEDGNSNGHGHGHSEQVIQTLVALVTGLKSRGNIRFNALVDAVLPTYQLGALELEPRVGQEDGPPLWPVLWRAFEDKRQRALRVLGHVTEPALERYWVNDWHREPYTRAPSLRTHAFRMILRGAVLRFLLVGHPAVDGLAAHHEHATSNAALPPEHHALLERALVETVQLYAKHIERDAQMIALLDEQLSPSSLRTDATGRARLFAQAC